MYILEVILFLRSTNICLKLGEFVSNLILINLFQPRSTCFNLDQFGAGKKHRSHRSLFYQAVQKQFYLFTDADIRPYVIFNECLECLRPVFSTCPN